MDKSRYLLIAGAMSFFPLGCASTPAPTIKAAQVEQLQCDASTSSQDDARILENTRVIAAEPIYSNIQTMDQVEHRVNGAKLVIRPPEGVSAERMTRVLQCHTARQLLGRSDHPELANDPYWLPDSWVDIRVTPEDGNYAVSLQADTITKNLQVYARAVAYADTHPL